MYASERSSQVQRQVERGFARAVISLPWFLGFAEGGLETWLFVGLGLALLLISQWSHPEASARPGSLVLEGGGVMALFILGHGVSEWGWLPQLTLACLEGSTQWLSSKA
ncbi:MAG TPA: hypothetical protein VFS50_00560 [Meiothermus sp.]|jgi:hypothetical protein|nr:hypothetical protein [Meiothermus sp.]